MQTRHEYLNWCKQRALQYVNRGDVVNAWASMASDLQNHPETANHAGIGLGMQMMMGGLLDEPEEMRKFVEGFR